MNEPVIQANESLVRNGEFADLQHWERSGLVGTGSEMYEGNVTSFLQAVDGGWVRQEMTLPKDPGVDAHYTLTFLCEIRHEESGWLRLWRDTQLLLEIELKPGDSRNSEQDRARLAAGQPLEFRPIKYEQALELPIARGDILRLEITSPLNEAHIEASRLRITHVDIQLRLAPLALQALQIDQETLAPGRTLHLCIGATDTDSHRLTFVPEPDNSWRETKAALIIQGNPQDAILATPDWQVDQPLQDQWLLDCPFLGDDQEHELTLNLLNQYRAEAYTIPVSLGHHRLAFGAEKDAAYYPIFEYGQQVQLGVRVVSFYTAQAISGRTVTWAQAGAGVKGAAVSGDDGWAYFDYQPTQAGEFVIEASVVSPYYAGGVVSRRFDVRVLATDPWRELSVIVDENATGWEATGYPNRGSAHPLPIRVPVDSPLLDSELSLHWRGDSQTQLGVVVSPALEQPVPVDSVDTVWTLTSDDSSDGRFVLSLVCSKLLLPSPDKPMSLARNRVKVGEVRGANKFPIVDEQESVLLRVQVLHDVTLGDGDPVTNALVDWETPEDDIVRTVTGAGGWASLLYTPKSAGARTVTASVKAHAEASAIGQSFDVTAVATSPWKNQVNIFLDGVEVERNTLGVLCRRGQIHTLRVEPVSGSPWIGKSISLHWRDEAPAIGLQPADLDMPKALVQAGVQWQLASTAESSISSLFDLVLRLESVELPRELSGRLIAADLTEELSLVLDQIHAELDSRSLFPCLGARHRFNVLPNALSPLVGLQAWLVWSGTSAEALAATVQPALNAGQPLSDGGALWTLDFSASEQPGQFSLSLALPQLDFAAAPKPMDLAHNKVRIEAWRESPIEPVVSEDSAWMWVQVVSHFTDRAVDQAPVSWVAEEKTHEMNTAADGWSGFPFVPTSAGQKTVQASLFSRYDGYRDSQSMTVEALEVDPWKGVTVSFDGQPAQPWGEVTCFPRRRAQHTIHVMAAQNSPLFDHQLTLGMSGAGPAESGIRFEYPGLGTPISFSNAGFPYTFVTGDLKDASFALRLASSKLARLSPANAMSLGSGTQVLKILASQRATQTLLWGEAVSEQISVVSSVSGRPMAGLTVTWRSPELGVVTTVTNFYGVAKIRFVPTTPGAIELTATVGDAQYSESVSFAFFLDEPRQIKSLFSVDSPGQQVHVGATVVSALTGKPLPDVWVKWTFENVSLLQSKTNEDGIAMVIFKRPLIRQGFLQALVKGGLAGWEIQSLAVPIDVP
ncbi:hypothetical protein [Pseudomonas monsensis]|uniref:hypothetical protein n=1 Tax=Pseudomonas monsensis TaxID=2745509 RepID=UPI00300F662E